MILDCFEDCTYCLFVGRIDSFFSLSLEENKIAFKQGLEVVRNHALFLSKGFSEFIYAHRLFQ